MRIDVHAHYLPLSCFNVQDNKGRHYGPTLLKDDKGEEKAILDGSGWGAVPRRSYDPEVRIREMDETGVSMQVLSPSNRILYYNLPAEDALWYSRRVNDGIAETVRQYPTRFAGLASIPLQEPARALGELDRAINKLGLRGVAALTMVNSWELDNPALDVFYEEVQKLDVPIYLHPMVSKLPRMERFHLINLVGNPLDTTLAAAHLIFGGVLDRFSRLKIYLSHAGGYLPYIIGRFGHGYEVRKEARMIIPKPPIEYFRLLYFDTITHSVPTLEYVIKFVGADKVMMGTDYPADMADSRPVETVNGLAISEKDKALVLGGNAVRIFKL